MILYLLSLYLTIFLYSKIITWLIQKEYKITAIITAIITIITIISYAYYYAYERTFCLIQRYDYGSGLTCNYNINHMIITLAGMAIGSYMRQENENKTK